jgi:hypothetical protein
MGRLAKRIATPRARQSIIIRQAKNPTATPLHNRGAAVGFFVPAIA